MFRGGPCGRTDVNPVRTRPQAAHARATAYRRLRNPFAPQSVFSDDAVASMHENALKVLETLGIKVLLPEARALYAGAGALVDESTEMVRLGRDIIAATLAELSALVRGVRRRPGAHRRVRGRLARLHRRLELPQCE